MKAACCVVHVKAVSGMCEGSVWCACEGSVWCGVWDNGYEMVCVCCFVCSILCTFQCVWDNGYKVVCV